MHTTLGIAQDVLNQFICCQLPISPYPVTLPRKDFIVMVKLVRLLHRLSVNNAYQHLLHDHLPAVAHFNPGHFGVMMGYDFHLTKTGPKLIEVNTNAGGAWFAYLSENAMATQFSGRLAARLLNSFLVEFARYKRSRSAKPSCMAILDEHPESQFLYLEMQKFAELFRRANIKTVICDPLELRKSGSQLYFGDQTVDMIYNRHCDFYLQTPALADIKNAWLEGGVCLSPHPHIYGLLADKRRMVLWSDVDALRPLDIKTAEQALLRQCIPYTTALASLSSDAVWRTRKQWVLKPDNGYASRGVYVGNKLTATKLAHLPPESTLAQQWIPPSTSTYPDELPFKTDFRLFAYRHHILGVAARLYQGQVTNLRTPNGGFAKVILS
jgi:hypothetical protein